MTSPDTLGRLRQVLIFLSVSGGAALVSKQDREVVLAVGDLSYDAAIEGLTVSLDADAIGFAGAHGVVADVGRDHRLFVRMPAHAADVAFVRRVRRARDLIERFGLHRLGPTPPRGGTPPGSLPAHVRVLRPSSRSRPS